MVETLATSANSHRGLGMWAFARWLCSRTMHVAPASQSQFFDTQHLKGQVTQRSVSGGVVTSVSQGSVFCIKLATTAVLARFLTPGDFGLVAMAVAVTGFAEMFKDAGLSMATVQRPEVNHDQVSTLFWINVALGLALMVCVCLLSPVIAWFYGEPRLVAISFAMAGVFPLGGVAIQHQALLRRQMRFGTLAIIEVLSQVAGASLGIVAALCGAGYWALVAMAAGTAVTTAMLVWACCRWVPGRPGRGHGVRDMLAFGGNLAGFNITNYWLRNADKIFVGWQCGAISLGLYGKAYQLLLLPLSQFFRPITGVVIPGLCRVSDSEAEYRSYFITALSVLAWFTAPAIAFSIVMAPEIILVVLGEQWHGAAPIFSVLALGGLFQPVASSMGWVFLSLGQADRMFRWAIIVLPVFLLGYLVGVHWGATGVAWGFVIAASLNAVGSVTFACKQAPFSPGDVIKAVAPPYLNGALLFVVLVSLRLSLPSFSPVELLLIAIGVTGAGVVLRVLAMLRRATVRTAIVGLLRARIVAPASAAWGAE